MKKYKWMTRKQFNIAVRCGMNIFGSRNKYYKYARPSASNQWRSRSKSTLFINYDKSISPKERIFQLKFRKYFL